MFIYGDIPSCTLFFQIANLLGTVLERPILKAQYSASLPKLLTLIKKEHDTVKVKTKSFIIHVLFSFVCVS